MKTLTILIVLAATGCITALASLPAAAATSSAMKTCSHEWSVMKKANKIPEGQKWSEFWSQCSKDYAAKNGSETATEKPAKTKTAAVSEDDSSGFPLNPSLKKFAPSEVTAKRASSELRGKFFLCKRPQTAE
jgi:hypothetical protein